MERKKLSLAQRPAKSTNRKAWLYIYGEKYEKSAKDRAKPFLQPSPPNEKKENKERKKESQNFSLFACKTMASPIDSLFHPPFNFSVIDIYILKLSVS